MHRSKAIGSERRARPEQFREGLLVAIEQIVGSRLLSLVGHDDPAAIVVRLALDAELETGELRLKQRKISGDAGGNVDPLLPGSGYSHCVDLIGRGMQDELEQSALGCSAIRVSWPVAQSCQQYAAVSRPMLVCRSTRSLLRLNIQAPVVMRSS